MPVDTPLPAQTHKLKSFPGRSRQFAGSLGLTSAVVIFSGTMGRGAGGGGLSFRSISLPKPLAKHVVPTAGAARRRHNGQAQALFASKSIGVSRVRTAISAIMRTIIKLKGRGKEIKNKMI